MQPLPKAVRRNLDHGVHLGRLLVVLLQSGGRPILREADRALAPWRSRLEFLEYAEQVLPVAIPHERLRELHQRVRVDPILVEGYFLRTRDLEFLRSSTVWTN